MERAPKKAREHYWCKRLKELLGDFPEGQIDPSHENPDLRINSPRGIIGVEVREVCEPGVEKQLSLRSRVLKQAGKLYETAGHPRVDVSVLFSEYEPLRKPQVGFLAERLSAIVIRNLPPQCASAEEHYNWLNRSYFPIHFDAVYVRRYSELTKSHWSCPSFARPQTIGVAQIQEILDGKEPRLNDYRLACPSVWLIIAIDGFRSSSVATLEATLSDHYFKSSFDRIFVPCDRHHVVELKKHQRIKEGSNGG